MDKNNKIIVIIILLSFLIVTLIFNIYYNRPIAINAIININENIYSEIVSNKYIDNGFNLVINSSDVINPSIAIKSVQDTIEYKLEKKFENMYEANIDITKLKNGIYQIYLKDDKDASLINNNLDLLEQLVRSKINDKLITFDYENQKMSFKIEDFIYEYDILIDPGHGGIDAGTTNSTMDEAELNLIQSMYEKERYEEHGLKVLLARQDDGDGMLTGSDEWNRAKQRGYAIGFYGVTAKIIYSNHHNSAYNGNTSGFEILVSNSLNYDNLKTELKIIDELNKIYPQKLIKNKFQIYSRDYETGDVFNKINSDIYDYRDYYATIRIPLELYNVKTVTYEGCYMSSKNDFDWYYNQEGWKLVSEIKIKYYVESLGKTYQDKQISS